MQKVVVATQNPAKIEAIENALADFYSQTEPQRSFEITAIEVVSGVSDSPLSDEEGIQGCNNRLEAAQAQVADAALYFAMEGVISPHGRQWFIRGWTKLYNAELNRSALASGASVPVPTKVADTIDPNRQFSLDLAHHYDLTDEEKAIVRNLGANGVFSGATYQRKNTFYDGAKICLGYIENDRNWE